MRTPDQALAQARRWTSCRTGMCLWTVQEWFAAPHAYPDAWTQWLHTRQHTGTPPPGVPVFYSGGRHGHIAISAGGGRIRSTDCPTDGRVGETDLNWPLRRWGHRYVGWGSTLGGVAIPGIGAPSAPATGGVYLGKLRSGQRDSDSVRVLQQALNAHHLAPPGNITLPITGNFGPKTEQVVVACQRQHGFGGDAPGRVSVGPRQAAHLGLRVVG